MVDLVYKPRANARRKQVNEEGARSVCGYCCQIIRINGSSDIDYITTNIHFSTPEAALEVEDKLVKYADLCIDQY